MRKLFLLMMSLLLSQAALAGNEFILNGMKYTILDETSVSVEKLHSNDTKRKGKLVIPQSVKHDGKTYIVTKVDSWGFFGNEGVTEIQFPPTLTTIGMFAFCRTGISSLTLPEATLDIGSAAFENCQKLSSVKLPSQLTVLQDRVFQECTALEHIDLPQHLTQIGGSAFSGSGLKEITLPENVSSLGGYCFAYSKNLESISLPENLTTLGNNVFAGCEALKAITLPEGVKKLGQEVFNYCPNLETLNLPASLEEIASSPFASCKKLKNINLPPGSKNFKLVGGVLYTFDMKHLIGAPINLNVGDFTVPETVEYIAPLAFYSNQSLTSLKMTSVKEIGQSAFNNCYNLATLDLGNSIIYISKHAFYSCRSLTEITLPKSLKETGFGSFDFCTGLKQVYLFEPFASNEEYFNNVLFDFCDSGLRFIITAEDGKKRTIGYGDLYDYKARFRRYHDNIREIPDGKDIRILE